MTEFSSSPTEGDCGEPNFTTPSGIPICSECGKSTRDRNALICATCRAKEEREFQIPQQESIDEFAEAVVKAVRTGSYHPNVFHLTEDDMDFLHQIGALEMDWRQAGMLWFQDFIHKHGTAEEQTRIRAMNVGYPW